MPDFRRIITMAYLRILNRPPDPGGLEAYNRAMNQGMSEAQMRESFLRSAEYAARFPDQPQAATAYSPRKKKLAGRKKTLIKKKIKKKKTGKK